MKPGPIKFFQNGNNFSKGSAMNMNEIKQMLKPYGLKLTLPRLKVIEVFLANDKAVTYGEVLRLTEETFDRVTIYRTLKSFEDLGIIHRIVGANSSPNYALSGAGKTNTEKPRRQHLHFSCIKCNGVYCLDDHLVPQVILPDIYEVHSLNMIVIGICNKCINIPHAD
jgi:Fur family ferric uptake transcriptional regulator